MGETISEKDIDIHQTKGEDQVYYYLTVAGAPLVILGMGLSFVFMRRNRPRRGAPPPKPAEAKKTESKDEGKKSEEKKS